MNFFYKNILENKKKKLQRSNLCNKGLTFVAGLFLVFCFFGIFSQAEAVIITPGVGQGGSANSLNNGLIGWWTFDNQDMLNGAVKDKSGNGNTGNLVSIATSTFYTPGKIGQGFRFDGTDDYIQTASADMKTLDSFSFSLWFKAESTSARHILWQGQNGANGWGNEQEMHLSLGGTLDGAGGPVNNKLSFFMGSTTGATTNLNVINDFTDTTQWHFVVVTVSNIATSPSATMYVDNVLWGTDTASPGVIRTSWNTNLVIGGRSARFHRGKVDDVRVWNRALSASEISQLYKQGQATVGATQNPKSSQTTLDSGLVGYWTFNNQDMLNGAVKDKSGNGNHGNLVNIATSTFYTQGKFGQGFKFDGVNDYISMGNVLDMGTNSFSVGLWLNTTFNSLTGLVSENGSPAYFRLEAMSGGAFRFQLQDGTVAVGPQLNEGVNYYDGKWHYVVFTVDRSSPTTGLRIYFDGVSRAFGGGGTYDLSLLGSISSTGNLIIGARTSGAGFFKGSLDDVRIYNRALSASEISQLYKQGQVTIGATQNPRPNQTTLDSGLVGYWTFNNQDMTSGRVNDKSGNGNHGNLFNIATSTFYTQGKFGQGFKFDGVDDYMLIPGNMSSFFTNQEVSFNIWLKRSEHTPASSLATGAWYFNTSDANNHYVWTDGAIYDGTFKTTRNSVGAGLISNRKNWHMVTITRKAGANGWNYYQNGNLVQSSDGGTWQFATSNYKIGQSRDSVYNFRGVMDEARLYNRVLSTSEIRQLYNMGR